MAGMAQALRPGRPTPALSPFCSADSAKRGEGETLPAVRHGEAVWLKGSVKMHPVQGRINYWLPIIGKGVILLHAFR